MPLDHIDESLLLAAWFRGRRTEHDEIWTSNADQIVTLSLFYTGGISADECARRFSRRSYISSLYDSDGALTQEIAVRDQALVELVMSRPNLLERGGDWTTPCYPTFRACGLTPAGLELASTLIDRFPTKPDFPNWPDERPPPDS